MGKISRPETLFSKVSDIDRRLAEVEAQLHSDVSTHKLGSLILTPQADSFFTDDDKKITGHLAVKGSNKKIYLYNGSSWVAF